MSDLITDGVRRTVMKFPSVNVKLLQYGRWLGTLNVA